MTFPNSPNADILDAYRLFMELTRRDLLGKFDDRCKSNPGSARCEAVVFSLLKNVFSIDPKIHEHPSLGGPDFAATHSLHPELFCEVKYLETESVAAKSGLPKEPDGQTRWSAMITSKIENALKDATSQLANQEGPGICVVGSDHPDASQLLGTFAAAQLLTSDTKIQVPIAKDDRPAGEPRIITDLKNAAFSRPPKNSGEPIQSLRKPISAVLLLAFNYKQRWAQMTGILSPDPVRPLDYRVFPGVPFARFDRPPVPGGKSSVEFVVADPQPRFVQQFTAVQLDEKLLRNE